MFGLVRARGLRVVLFLPFESDFLSDELLEIVFNIGEFSLHILEENFAVVVVKVLEGTCHSILWGSTSFSWLREARFELKAKGTADPFSPLVFLI